MLEGTTTRATIKKANTESDAPIRRLKFERRWGGIVRHRPGLGLLTGSKTRLRVPELSSKIYGSYGRGGRVLYV